MGMKFPDAGLQYVTLDGHAYMGALWWMSNKTFTSMPEDMRAVVNDGFYALQQATFASPKRKSIQAYADFVAGGGDLYVPTPSQKTAFEKRQHQFMIGLKITYLVGMKYLLHLLML